MEQLLNMDRDLKVILGVVALIWVVSTIVVVRMSPLRTHWKYVDALLAFPATLVILPSCVYAAEHIAPVLIAFANNARHDLIAWMNREVRHAVAVAITLMVVGSIPALLFFYWRRLLQRHEERIMSGRIHRHSFGESP